MLQPFRNNIVLMHDSPVVSYTPQRIDRAQNQSNKMRSMSTNHDIFAPAPRMSGFMDDMLGPMNIINTLQNHFMGKMNNMMGINKAQMMRHEPSARSGESLSAGMGGGKLICHTYVTETKLGPDGRPYKEQYFSKSYAARGADGTTLSEKQQAYQNTGNGLQRIALEKKMNDQGRKMVQERIKGQNEQRSHNYFLNLDEKDADAFEEKWIKKGQEMGFMNAFGQALGYNNYEQTKQIPRSQWDESPNVHAKQQRSAKPKPKAQSRRSHNDLDADIWGLGSDEVRTSQTPRNYTNNDVYIPERAPPRAVRARANTDIRPTIPGRAVGGTSSLNNLNSNRANVQRSNPTANTNVQRAETDNSHAPAHQNPPTPNRNLAAHIRGHNTNNNPTNAGGVDIHGNFRNKNPQNSMPKAG